MTNEKARETFETLCKVLEGHDWHYEKDENKLEVECGAQGEDLPIELRIRIDAEREIIILLSQLPFKAPEEKRLDMALAVSMVNNMLVDGSFDYDVRSGCIIFRMTSSFKGSTIGNDTFTYMLLCSCETIDEYNDKFFMIGKGMLTLEQFIKNNN